MKKYVIWFAIGLVVIAWGILSLIPLYCALNFTCDPDAGSFWTLFLQAVAVPILLFELYRLRKTIQASIWEPEIETGFAIVPFDGATNFETKDTKWDTSLVVNSVEKILENPRSFASSNSWETAPSHFKEATSPIRFVIRNRGKAAAKYLKIVLSLVSFPGDESPEISSRDERLEKLADGFTFIYRQDSNKILFPGDFEIISVSIGSNRNKWSSIYDHHLPLDFSFRSPSELEEKLAGLKIFLPILPQDGVYTWRVTIWAEGRSSAKSEDLSITVSNKNLLTLIEVLESQSKSRSTDFQSSADDPYIPRRNRPLAG